MGLELTMNSAAALYFTDEFEQTTASAAAIASVYGWVAPIGTCLGGHLSDVCNRHYGLHGRLLVQFFGCITMGGFDYHTGERGTGEIRDLRAGRCMGACLEYAARLGVPLMLYVFSDGSVASNGQIDDTPEGRGKGEWTGDALRWRESANFDCPDFCDEPSKPTAFHYFR